MFESIYHKLSRDLENYFRREQFSGRLPGVLPLSKRFNVSKNTVSKALHILAARGIITIENCRGMFLCPQNASGVPRQQHRVIGVSGFYDDIMPSGVSTLDKINRKYRKYGYNLVGIELPKTLSQQRSQWLKQLPIDGAILLNSASHPFLLDFFYENNLPVIGAPLPGYEHLTGVEPDHYQTYCRILQELMALGHRRIALIWFKPPKVFQFYFELIIQAFRDTLGDFFDEALLWYPEPYPDTYDKLNRHDHNYTRNALAKFLSLPAPPTAVIGQPGLLKHFAENAAHATLRVPEDISLYAVSYPRNYDRFYHTAIVRDDIAVETAFRKMISILNGKQLPPEKIFIPMTFIPGKSIAAAKK